MFKKNTFLSVCKIGVTFILATALLSACVGYVAPGGNWVPGHWGRHGAWVPGHYAAAPVVVSPVVVGEKWKPGHVTRSGWWKPGHWK